jgi:hypothetical protein
MLPVATKVSGGKGVGEGVGVGLGVAVGEGVAVSEGVAGGESVALGLAIAVSLALGAAEAPGLELAVEPTQPAMLVSSRRTAKRLTRVESDRRCALRVISTPSGQLV